MFMLSAWYKVGMTKKKKDPAAVSLGRRGGLKSEEARMKKMTAERPSEFARNAVLTQ